MSTEAETPTMETATGNPLLACDIRPIQNWQEWLEHWEIAKTRGDYYWMESLLHCGFNVRSAGRGYTNTDRYIFYLKVADGWCHSTLLRTLWEDNPSYVYEFGYDSNGHRIYATRLQLRQRLAFKAFNMLCQSLFKTEKKGGGRHLDDFNELWVDDITSEQLFTIIQHFFRVIPTGYNNRHTLINLNPLLDLFGKSPSHNERLTIDFLLNLAEFIWEWRDPSKLFCSDEEKAHIANTRLRLDTAKPWMIDVLACLGRLDILTTEQILQFDKACLAKLKEIALQTRLENKGERNHVVVESRRVATVDEACYMGSRAGWLLKQHELLTREDKRLKAIQTAKEQQDRAGRKIKELTSK